MHGYNVRVMDLIFVMNNAAFLYFIQCMYLEILLKLTSVNKISSIHKRLSNVINQIIFKLVLLTIFDDS